MCLQGEKSALMIGAMRLESKKQFVGSWQPINISMHLNKNFGLEMKENPYTIVYRFSFGPHQLYGFGRVD